MDENTIGLQISELEYRELPYPSYSLLSDMSKVGSSAIDGVRNTDINELDGVMVGKLVDNLLTENKLPDNFYVVKKKPTGKAKDILRVLAKTRQYHPNKTELLHPDNHDLINKCCDTIKYNSGSRSVKRIDGLKNYQDYYNVLINSPEDSFIISDYLYYQAKQCVKIIRDVYPYIIDGFGGNKVIAQVKLLGEVNKCQVKGMLDFVVIDDISETITPYDLKTGSYPATEFLNNGYLGWNYYIQSALYYELFKEEIKKHPIYKNYRVDPFKFVYVSRMDGSHCEFIVPKTMHHIALNGWEVTEKQEDGTFVKKPRKGVHTLLNEYNYYKKK